MSEQERGFTIGAEHLVEQGATSESAACVITFYESFFEQIGKAAFDGSALVYEGPYVCPEGTEWKDLPPPVQRAWARSALASAKVYREKIDEMHDKLRLLKFKKAEDSGELPKLIENNDPPQ
jgi:hypothetical protein